MRITSLRQTPASPRPAALKHSAWPHSYTRPAPWGPGQQTAAHLSRLVNEEPVLASALMRLPILLQMKDEVRSRRLFTARDMKQIFGYADERRKVTQAMTMKAWPIYVEDQHLIAIGAEVNAMVGELWNALDLALQDLPQPRAQGEALYIYAVLDGFVRRLRSNEVCLQQSQNPGVILQMPSSRVLGKGNTEERLPLYLDHDARLQNETSPRIRSHVLNFLCDVIALERRMRQLGPLHPDSYLGKMAADAQDWGIIETRGLVEYYPTVDDLSYLCRGSKQRKTLLALENEVDLRFARLSPFDARQRRLRLAPRY